MLPGSGISKVLRRPALLADIYSGSLSCNLFGILSAIHSGILPDIYFDSLSDIISGIHSSSLSGLYSDSLSSILCGTLCGILLAIYLVFFLALYLAFYFHMLYVTFYEVQRCSQGSGGARLRSNGAHWERSTTRIRSWQLRSSSAHWDPELARRSGQGGGRGGELCLKSNILHLENGKKGDFQDTKVSFLVFSRIQSAIHALLLPVTLARFLCWMIQSFVCDVFA